MRAVRWFIGGLLLLLVIAALGVWIALRASLPQLDGELVVAELSESVTIERDRAGTPVITANNRADLAFATGFAHAQDRFFQMDMMRRAAAGELAALLGPSLVETDKRLRVHGFRYIARQVLEDATEADRELLEAYVAGVNASVDALASRPWEYLVLGSMPERWLPEDSFLAAFSMYLSLNDSSGETELARGYLHANLPPELYAFLHPLGTEWDAPLSGGVWQMPEIPGADIFDLRSRNEDPPAPATATSMLEDSIVGSNAWAVNGALARDGGALLASDMHLGLRLPNTWYRARMIVRGSGEEQRDLAGVTLPGLPVLVAGSNGHVAWSYTNSYGDWTDLVILESDAHASASDEPTIATRREEIRVRGAPAESIDVQMTRWGPIVRNDAAGRPLALAWTAHHRTATNLRMFDFERARTLTELLDAANRAGGPVQNVIAVDAAGAIGWSLMGRVPIRAGYDSTRPAAWRADEIGWIGWRDPQTYPRIIDPPNGRLWSANARMIDARSWIEFLGDGGYDLGARGAQIRDGLLAITQPTAADMARIQLDDRALFLVRWRDLLLDLLDEEEESRSDARTQMRQHVEQWSARASIDDIGYRIVRAFRLQVRKDVFEAITASVRAQYPDIKFAPSPQFEGPLWRLVSEQPVHLLDPRYATWKEALLAALDTVAVELQRECGDLDRCTWGRQNTLQMRHPLSSALPFASRWLDMPAEQVPGDAAMPRVQGPQFGASERFVISPGREAEGSFQMPGGPVDHPLSPFYRAGHDAWVRGKPQPFLPGPPEHRLTLSPNADRARE